MKIAIADETPSITPRSKSIRHTSDSVRSTTSQATVLKKSRSPSAPKTIRAYACLDNCRSSPRAIYIKWSHCVMNRRHSKQTGDNALLSTHPSHSVRGVDRDGKLSSRAQLLCLEIENASKIITDGDHVQVQALRKVLRKYMPSGTESPRNGRSEGACVVEK